jgi:hypothetical protein
VSGAGLRLVAEVARVLQCRHWKVGLDTRALNTRLLRSALFVTGAALDPCAVTHNEMPTKTTRAMHSKLFANPKELFIMPEQ